MADNIYIKKGGLKQTVSRQAYGSIYKPSGWEIDETETLLDEIQETVRSLEPKGEHEVKNYLAMKKRVPNKFDDGLFRSEEKRR